MTGGPSPYPCSLQGRATRSAWRVFDFDRVVFEDMYEERGLKSFRAYVRYYLSDHRPIWAAIDTAEG